MYLSQWQVPNPKRAGVEGTQMRRGRTAHTITVPPNWLLSEERDAPSLSLPLASRISARARARRAYAHVRVPPGRDGVALRTTQRTKYCDDTQKRNQMMKKTVATERARTQTKGRGTRIRISARAYVCGRARASRTGSGGSVPGTAGRILR